MSGSEYLLWSYGQFEKMTFSPPDPLSTYWDMSLPAFWGSPRQASGCLTKEKPAGGGGGILKSHLPKHITPRPLYMSARPLDFTYCSALTMS